MVGAAMIRALTYTGLLFVAVLLLTFLSACGHAPPPLPVEHAVVADMPVAVPCRPEPGLLAPLDLPTPHAHAPWTTANCPPGADCKVISGLYAEDESALMMREALLFARLDAWIAWGGCRP